MQLTGFEGHDELDEILDGRESPSRYGISRPRKLLFRSEVWIMLIKGKEGKS